MSIQEGDRIPDITIKTNGPDGPKDISTAELFDRRRVVLFAVPGAFTPGCSNTHMPGFVIKADEILARGVDAIVCMAVNDAFVMDAWQKAQNAENITMLADGSGRLTEALGLTLDLTDGDMGKRCKRFAMIVNDGVVTYLGIDDKGVAASSAGTILDKL